MKGVNIKETRLIDQAIGKNNFRYLTLEEHAIVDKALKWLKESELYLSVWKDVEKKANEIVNEKCEPEWNRISEEIDNNYSAFTKKFLLMNYLRFL